MSGIFVSYRRAGASVTTYRLVDELKSFFQEYAIFFDVESIDPGIPFAEVIQNALDKSTIALVIIGPDWATMKDSDDNVRLHNQDDWVRHEVRAAMASNARVIPVLVEGADMPEAHLLPDDIRKLFDLQAFTIAKSPEYWAFDTKRLCDKLLRVDPKLPLKHTPNQEKAAPLAYSRKVIAGFAVFCLFFIIYALSEDADADTFYGLAVFFIVAFVLHVLGFIDVRKKIVLGNAGAITGMVLSGFTALGCIGLAAEQEDLESFGVPDNESVVPQQALVSPVNSQRQQNIMDSQVSVQLSGAWRDANGTRYQFVHLGSNVSFIEYDAFNNQIGSGRGNFSNNILSFQYYHTLTGLGGSGQMTLNPEGTILAGTFTESTTGYTVQQSIFR